MEEPTASKFDSRVGGGSVPPVLEAASPASAEPNRARSLPLVESAFFASTTSLLWLVNAYIQPGPRFDMFFYCLIALVYQQWGVRAAAKTTVTVLLLSVLMGPPRSLFSCPMT